MALSVQHQVRAWPVIAPAIRSESKAEPRDDDERRIRKVVARLAASWEKGDAAAYAIAFTEDSDYVTFAGERLVGQFENADLHDALFSSVLAGTKLVCDVESIRFLTDDVAVVHTTGAVLMPWQRAAHLQRRSVQTLVFVRRYQAWRIAAFHNTRIRPMPTSGPAVWLMNQYMRVRRALSPRAGGAKP